MIGKIKKNKGFSLVEMLVVALILSLVIGVATGFFASTVKVQRYNLEHQKIFNQTTFAVEYIGRAIKMAQRNSDSSQELTCLEVGENYRLINQSRIRFINSDGDCQEIFRRIVNGNGVISYTINDGSPIDITSRELNVYSLVFNITGESSSDQLQPRVTYIINTTLSNMMTSKRLEAHTTISQRRIDI